MTRIQRYIVGLKDHERKLRDEQGKETDPFKEGKANKRKVRRLGYAKPDVESRHLNTTALHRMWFADENEHEEAMKVHSFLSWQKWRTGECQDGAVAIGALPLNIATTVTAPVREGVVAKGALSLKVASATPASMRCEYFNLTDDEAEESEAGDVPITHAAPAKPNEVEEGGITWLELYLLYSRHGGNEDEERKREREIL